MNDSLQKAMMDRRGKNIMLTIKLDGMEETPDEAAKAEGLAPPAMEEGDAMKGAPEEMAEQGAEEQMQEPDMLAMLKESMKDDFEGAKGLRGKVKDRLMKG